MKKDFEILDLNEENINSFYNMLLANSSTERTHHYQLYSNNDQHSLRFDTKKISLYRSTIKYMIGQLQNAHINKQSFSFKESILTYKNEIWTKDTSTLMKFIYLGIATNSLSPIDSSTKSIFLSPSITPTLSPKDPNFKQWLKTDGKEWEEELGQEPSDD